MPRASAYENTLPTMTLLFLTQYTTLAEKILGEYGPLQENLQGG